MRLLRHLLVIATISGLGACDSKDDKAPATGSAAKPAAKPADPTPAKPTPTPAKTPDAPTKGAAKVAEAPPPPPPPPADPCPDKTGPECLDLGLDAETGGNGAEKDVPRAAALFHASCERDDLTGCAYYADMLLDAKGVPLDDVEAMKNYAKACKGKIAVGCLGVGILYDRGQGVDRDDALAYVWYDRACKAGSKRGCVYQGDFLRDGRGIDKDAKAAVKVYQTACAKKEGLGCVGLGYMLETGDGIGKNVKKAISMYQSACENKEPKGCGYWADLLETGTGTTKDLVKAAEINERGCAANYYTSCASAAILYVKAEGGVKHDTARAVELSQLACDHRIGRGCHVRGWINERDDAPDGKDVSKAIPYFEQACAMDYYEACWAAGDLYHAGSGTKRDDAKAKVFLEKACKGNKHEKACDMLTKLP